MFKVLESKAFFCVCAVIVHVILLISVVDIQYRIPEDAPVVKQRCLYHTNTTQKSKRLVFFLSDGLRADSLYKKVGEVENSFLRKKMENGTWGISLARSPTLSRQGILAMFTGKPFPNSELVKSLTKILSFDFKKSRSPDNVLGHFKNVYFVGNIAVAEYFGNYSNTWIKETFKSWREPKCHYNIPCYDEWSFARLNRFLDSKRVLEIGDDLAIFIYLYGQDFCGHEKTPLDKRCLDEINFIDKRVGELSEKIEKIFNDSLTTYLFTSDHGHTNWGTHGWLTKHERETPIVMWGNGVAKSSKLPKSPKNWKPKILLNQIDIAPLLSVLLAKPIPTETAGILHPEILTYDKEQKAKGMFCNAKGLQYLVNAIMTNYYPPNIDSHLKTKNKMNSVEKALKYGNFSYVISSSKQLVKDYLDIYETLTQDLYKTHLIVVVASAYLGWGLYLMSKFVTLEVKKSHPGIHGIINIIFALLTICITTFVVFSKWPFHFLMYFYLSIACWLCFVKNCIDAVFHFKSIGFSVPFKSIVMPFLTLPLSLIIIPSNNNRKHEAFFFMIMTICFAISKFNLKNPQYLHWSWISSSIMIMIVIQYPVVESDPNIIYSQASIFGWIFLIVTYIYYGNCSKRDSIWSFISLFSIVIAMLTVTLVHNNFKTLTFKISWFLLIVSILYPILSDQDSIKRLYHVIFAFATPFILLSIRQEATGLLSYSIHVLSWTCLEIKSKSSDTICALFFFFYIWVGYLAIGNIIYPTSYRISWTRCFLEEVGDAMIPVILYKHVIPIIILNASVLTLYKKIERSVFPLLIWYLFLNNCIAFYYFFGVKGRRYSDDNLRPNFMKHILSQIFPIAVISLLPFSNALINLKIPSQNEVSKYNFWPKKRETSNIQINE